MVVHLDLSVVSYTLGRFEIAFPNYFVHVRSQGLLTDTRRPLTPSVCQGGVLSSRLALRSPPRVSQNHQGEG